jgi:O-antigen/teichoic acid export membrane protein
MLSLIPMAGAYIIGTLLTANGSLKYLNIIALAGVTSSLIINGILIPKLGAYGAAITCLITQLIAFTLQLIVAIKLFKFTANRNLIYLLFPLVLISITGYFVNSVNWITGGLIILGLGGILTILALIPDLRLIRKLNVSKS